jgi:hypothetical protein
MLWSFLLRLDISGYGIRIQDTGTLASRRTAKLNFAHHRSFDFAD